MNNANLLVRYSVIWRIMPIVTKGKKWRIIKWTDNAATDNWGITVLIIVYIPTDADVSTAAETLENCVSRYENQCPESARLIMGDFIACDLQEKIPEYGQSFKCTTRGNNMLDKLYCNVRGGYRAYQRLQLGTSDHNMIFCVPTHKQVLKKEPCKVLQYRKWETENISKLQACLDCAHRKWRRR